MTQSFYDPELYMILHSCFLRMLFLAIRIHNIEHSLNCDQKPYGLQILAVCYSSFNFSLEFLFIKATLFLPSFLCICMFFMLYFRMCYAEF